MYTFHSTAYHTIHISSSFYEHMLTIRFFFFAIFAGIYAWFLGILRSTRALHISANVSNQRLATTQRSIIYWHILFKMSNRSNLSNRCGSTCTWRLFSVSNDDIGGAGGCDDDDTAEKCLASCKATVPSRTVRNLLPEKQKLTLNSDGLGRWAAITTATTTTTINATDVFG